MDAPNVNTNDDMNAYLQEACYYLRKKGLTLADVSEALEVSEKDAERLYREYESKVVNRIVQENEINRNLWEDIYNDSRGNEKVTFARDNGLYHCRRTDLEAMDSPALMSVFETSKKFLDFDMYKRYLNTKPPAGYDPMALQRQVKRALELIQEILGKRWQEVPRNGSGQTE